LSGTTRVSRYQKGKTNLDFTEARDSEWQWHQLGYMQTDSHASTTQFFAGRMPFVPPNQQRQSSEGSYISTYMPVMCWVKKCMAKRKTKEDLEKGCHRGLSST